MRSLPRIKLKNGYYIIRISKKEYHLGKDKKQAEAKARLLLANALTNPKTKAELPTVHYPTVEQIALMFCDSEASFYCSTRQKLFSQITRELAQLFTELPCNEFSSTELEGYQCWMANKSLSRTTIRGKLRVVRMMFRWAAKKKKCPKDVWESLLTVDNLKKGRSSAKEPKHINPVSLDVMNKTLEFCGPMIRNIILLQFHGGMRPEEVLTMKPCEIHRIGDVWKYVPAHHKNENKELPRNIFLGPKAQAVLLPYLEQMGSQSTEYLFTSARYNTERTTHLRAVRKTKVQPSQQGVRKGRENRKTRMYSTDSYSTKAYRDAIKRAAKRAGVEHWFPYQIRHAAGTLARQIGGLDGAQVFLGHANAQTTEIYAELDESKAAEIARKIG